MSTAELRPGLGVVRGTALYVAAIVGPGILTLPAIAAHAAGPASLAALAVLLAASAPIAVTFAAIERAAPGAGGVAGYVARAFGPLTGRIAGAWFYLGVPIGVPALGMIGGGYVAAATGGGKVTQLVVAAAVVAVAVAANLRHRPGTGPVPLVLTGILVVVIAVTAVASVPHADPDNLVPFAPEGWGAVAPAALVLTWVLTGWEAAANFGGMLRDLRRTLPRVTGWALGIVTLLYAAIAVPEILVLGPRAGSTDAPVAAVLALVIGRGAAAVAAVIAVTVALGNAIAYLGSLAELGAELHRGPASRPRVLLWPVLIMIAGLGTAALTPMDTELLVSICVGSQIPVYVLGLAAGLVLLPRRSSPWWLALVATAAVAGLLVPAGPYLAVPAAIAGIVVLRARRRGVPDRSASAPTPVV